MFQTFDLGVNKAATPQRVAALRQQLSLSHVTGFLIPRADAHQGEYVAQRDERLGWLTGFSGSAGVAIVLAERAAIFVDGRYTLQASDQVDTTVFEIVPIHKVAPHDWLEKVLNAGDRLAYDPWLHGKAEIDRLRTVADARKAPLVSLPDNPIDQIWEYQPPPPAGAVRIHPNAIAGEPHDAKRARIGADIKAAGAEAAVISLPDSLSWLLNIRGSDVSHSPVAQGFAIAHADGRVDLIMDPDKLGGDVRDHLGNQVTAHPMNAFAALLDSLPDPVLLDEATCPLWVKEQLDDAGKEVRWGRDPCVLPKAMKNDAELGGMRAAHIRDGAAMVRFLHWLDTTLAAGQDLTEIQIVKQLEEFRAENGDLHDISFDTICGSGPNGAIVHYRVNRGSDRTLVPGDLLLVDSGAQYPDGTTDITRTVATGPVKPDYVRDFTLVLRGMISISRMRWPQGLNGRDLDPMARAALWRAGLDYDHGTGHGVGACLNVHEGPQSLSRRGGAELKPGMILSNEPGHYVEGSHGIRIENLVIVEPPSVPEGGTRQMLGFETLTWCPIDRRLVDPKLMTYEDLDWLNAYHMEVHAKISPQLSDQVLEWLTAACAPIE